MVLSIKDINKQINSCLTSNFNTKIDVIGEVSGYKHSNGHAYFSLKDEESLINCIIWKSSFFKIKDKLINGNKIIASGKISTYQKLGTYQLIIDNFEQTGIGELQKKYNELKENMKKYFDDKHKKKLPKYINNIGIITAEGGAALQDVLYALKSKNFVGNIHIENCNVQGINCASSVCTAIDNISELDLDLILITRGGGSIEDLMGFSDEKLIKKIFKCSTCIISAIGHEVDFMLSDFVADIRAPTPSIAGSMIVEQQIKIDNIVEKFILTNKININKKISNVKNSISKIKDKLNDLNILINNYDDKFNKLSNSINNKFNNNFNKYKEKYNGLKSNLETYNINNKLSNGMNILLNDKNEIINSVEFFKNHLFIDNLKIKMKDGEVNIKILISP
jgi:exodeoxyribonuclease VII large subunit